MTIGASSYLQTQGQGRMEGGASSGAGRGPDRRVPQEHLAPNPGRWSHHALVHGEFFYSIPLGLLDAIAGATGTGRFDVDLWQLERELSQLNGDHSAWIGFFRNDRIAFVFLRETGQPVVSREDYLSVAPAGDPEKGLRQANQRLATARRNLRAYAGWLMTNPQFLREHAALWEQLRPIVAESGMPRGIMGPPPPGFEALGLQPNPDENQNAAVRACAQFCARWRLSTLVGPLLPQPIGPQIPAALPALSGQQAAVSGYGLIAIPDTMPLPTEADFRDMFASAVRPQRPEHLAEWYDLSGAANAARKPLPRYARLFELQHWYRLLMSRHPAAFHRQRGKLREVLAAFLGVSDDSIRRDLQLIERRLGKCWWECYPQPRVTPA